MLRSLKLCAKCSSHYLKPGLLSKVKNVSPKRRNYCQASGMNELATLMKLKEDRFKSIVLDVADLPCDTDAGQFEEILKSSVEEWRMADRPAAWIHIPIDQSHLIPAASKQGFIFHHAEGHTATMCQWLRTSSPNKLPTFGTHQIGVAGCVVNIERGEVLMVKDANNRFNQWKFPGGLSELREDLSRTAEREVFEETGVKSEFQGVLAFRQQHNQPGAFGRSDIFFLCHMNPVTYELNPDAYEIEQCQWMSLAELAESSATSPIVHRIIHLLNIGIQDGFQHVHLVDEEFTSVYKGLKYKLYHKDLESLGKK